MADIFISYKKERRDVAERLAKALELSGYSVWYDYHLEPGRRFAEEIEMHLDEARAAVVLWCRLSKNSNYVRDEATRAEAAGKIVPIMIDRLNPIELPLGFGQIETIDFSAWDGNVSSQQFARLLKRVGVLVGRPAIVPGSNVNFAAPRSASVSAGSPRNPGFLVSAFNFLGDVLARIVSGIVIAVVGVFIWFIIGSIAFKNGAVTSGWDGVALAIIVSGFSVGFYIRL